MLAHSKHVHAAALWTGPALCRPEGPPPLWYSPMQWTAVGPVCPRCRALAQAHVELETVEQQVARW